MNLCEAIIKIVTNYYKNKKHIIHNIVLALTIVISLIEHYSTRKNNGTCIFDKFTLCCSFVKGLSIYTACYMAVIIVWNMFFGDINHDDNQLLSEKALFSYQGVCISTIHLFLWFISTIYVINAQNHVSIKNDIFGKTKRTIIAFQWIVDFFLLLLLVDAIRWYQLKSPLFKPYNEWSDPIANTRYRYDDRYNTNLYDEVVSI